MLLSLSFRLLFLRYTKIQRHIQKSNAWLMDRSTASASSTRYQKIESSPNIEQIKRTHKTGCVCVFAVLLDRARLGLLPYGIFEQIIYI